MFADFQSTITQRRGCWEKYPESTLPSLTSFVLGDAAKSYDRGFQDEGVIVSRPALLDPLPRRLLYGSLTSDHLIVPTITHTASLCGNGGTVCTNHVLTSVC